MKLGDGLVEKDDSMATDEVGRVVDDDDDDDDQMEAAEFVIEMDDVQAHHRQVDEQSGEDGEITAILKYPLFQDFSSLCFFVPGAASK